MINLLPLLVVFIVMQTRITNYSPGKFTKSFIDKKLRTINVRRKATVKQLFKSRSKVTKISGPDKDYGDMDTELECD